MKGIKKILALVLVAIMAMGMVSAFAAIGNDSTNQETGVQEGNANAVTINTAVVITNNEGATAKDKTIVYPAMSFTYTATGATVEPGTTVTDNNEEDPEHPSGPAVTAQVKSGPADGITVSGGTIESGNVVLNKNGQEVVLVPTTFTGNIAKFDAAGIYRYEITDTSTAAGSDNLTALQNAGVVKGANKDQSFILDVYVKNGNSGLEFGGFVLTKDPTKTITPGNAATAKASGFDDVTVITDGGTAKLDPTTPADLGKNYSYTTYNVTLNKAVDGGLGDKKHGFPFAVAIGVQSGHPSLNYDYEVTGSDNTANNISLVSNSTIPATIYMSNGSLLKIWGLSPFATVNYTETNDTDSAYQVKVGKTAGATDIRSQVEKKKTETLAAWDTVQNVATGYAIGTTATINDDADEVHYTNTLNDISPTGLVLRFGPYMAMFAAGVALFIILGIKRRKNEEE